MADGVITYCTVIGADVVLTRASEIGLADWLDTAAFEIPATDALLHKYVVPVTAEVIV